MARRPPRPRSARPGSSPSPRLRPGTTAVVEAGAESDGLAWLGERLRRASLALTAALVAARGFWPSEFAAEETTGNGLTWVLAVLLTLGLGVIGSWIGGRARLRMSWADAGVVALVLLVGLAASRAAERRMAINLAWEWAAVGAVYLLVRNLPRTRAESSALAGVLAAAAVAVAAYGLYQVRVEFPLLDAAYRRDPLPILQKLGIEPNSPSRKVFEDRLLGSREPYATFALANSLAGFLVGPAVLMIGVGLEAALRGRGLRTRLLGLAAGLVPLGLVLACLVLTKSRSAWVGLAVGLAILAWRQRGQVPGKALAIGLGGVALTLTIVAAGAAATGGLDRKVLTESTKSLRYRWEYWVGAVGVIRERPWLGHGPGNFAGPYLRHMLPVAGEQITDPHNAVLEVAATTGVVGVAALLAAVGFGLRAALGPARPAAEPEPKFDQDDAPPRSARWIVASAGAGWLVVVLLGKLDPITQFDALARWLILGAGWLGAVGLGGVLWRREPVPASAAGAGAAAVAVNLLAAGGIGMTAVALMLWSLVALGQTLRDDRPEGRRRPIGGRLPSFVMAAGWAVALGLFLATIVPHWRTEARLDEVRVALDRAAAGRREPNWDAVDALYFQAAAADPYAARPWLALSSTTHLAWLKHGARGEDRAWTRVGYALDQAASPPRAPRSAVVAKLRARFAADFLRARDLADADARRLLVDRAAALAEAVGLDPTDATLRAERAEALSAVGRDDLAAREAAEALRLDRLTPHASRKLPEGLRASMRTGFPRPKPGPVKPLPTGR